ncbi:MAG: transporter substrate-binding domain-containing protein [Cytophagales bacterium]|nr:transporter substrate-binding domain-containing protein [Cytophagales bacterium]
MNRSILLLCSLVTLLCGIPSLDAQEKIVIGVDEFSTYLVDVVSKKVLQEAYLRCGVTVEFKKLPMDRALYLADNGEIDGIDDRIAGVEQQYPNLMMIPVPIASADLVVITKNISFIVNGWNSLKPYTIGYISGTKIIEKRTLGMKTEAVDTLQQVLKMLDHSRIDIVIHTRSALCDVRKMKLSTLKLLEPPLEHVNVYHYLNKKHQALHGKLKEVLTRMADEQVIERIQKEAYQEWLTSCQ